MYALAQADACQASRAKRQQRLRYLVAFSVHILERIEEVRHSGVPERILHKEQNRQEAADTQRSDGPDIGPVHPGDKEHRDCDTADGDRRRQVRLPDDQKCAHTCDQKHRQDPQQERFRPARPFSHEPGDKQDDRQFRPFTRHECQVSDAEPSHRTVTFLSDEQDRYKSSDYEDQHDNRDLLVYPVIDDDRAKHQKDPYEDPYAVTDQVPEWRAVRTDRRIVAGAEDHYQAERSQAQRDQ